MEGYTPPLPQQYVDTGKYVVSKAANQTLVACLGTRVGVTLCDRTARIGGLYHILLPKPTGAEIPWEPTYYASTGLPLFIEALCNVGACKKRLEACIAGGVLVGPLTNQDFDLDLGGHTVEIVQRILRDNAIPVTTAETGGFFSCKLIHNLKSFETVIEPIGVPEDIEVKFKKPTPDDIDAAISAVQPIPQVALKIIRMINNRDYDMRKAAKEVQNDQIISARVISLCNSALFGLKTQVDSIDRALILLGEKHLLQLVLSASVELFFPQEKRGYSLCKGGLYFHALRTALVAENIARSTDKVRSDIAFTAGLLHDIGKPVIDQYIDQAYPLFYRMVQEKGRNLIEVEQEFIGITHVEVGKRLAEMWSLPDILIDPITFHHEPHKTVNNYELSYIVYIADVILSLFQTGQELDRLDKTQLFPCLQKIGIELAEFPLCIDLIPRNIFAQSRLF